MTRPTAYLNPMPVRGRIARPQPKGLPIINMGFNELPYPALPAVETALRAASAQVQSYGTPYCDALRKELADVNGIDADNIVCGNGSEELLDLVTRVFARPGDEVLISENGYIHFSLATNRVGATLVKAPETDLKTDVDALLARASQRTKVVFLANPNNPTGTSLPVSELRRLADNLPEQAVLVLDLAYGEFWGEAHCKAVHGFVSGYDNVLVTRTFSKAYGLAGVRVGWCHGPDWMVPLIYAARGMGTVNALGQAAATAALSELDLVRARTAELTRERERLRSALQSLSFEVAPSDTNFLMLRHSQASPETTERLVEHLFDDAGIIVNRTREAGLESYFRFSLSLPDHNDLLLNSVQSHLKAGGS